jgi:sterol desaturase/sphingolipid hydroxylase (fatty acid hydroxylase superfamily)
MRLPLVVQFPLALLFSDLLGYWSHRLHHRAPLWRFHAIHHSPRDLDWMAGARNHPVAEAAGRICIGIPLILLGVDFRVLAAMIPFIGLWAVFLHANIRWTLGPLRWVIATPHFHRWHHSRSPEAREKNFAALFPIWDLIFGTLYLPDRLPDDFGVDAAENVPSTFVAQLVYPFRRR